MSTSEPSSATPPRATWASPSLSALGLIFAALLLLVIGGAAWAGYQAGQAQRAARAQAAAAAELQTQFQRGVEDLNAARFRLAASRFQYILEREPNYPGASDRLAEARRALQVTAVPTPVATEPLPVLESQDPAEILALAQQLTEKGNWDGALFELALVRALDPAHEPATVDGLIFTVLRARGIARIQSDATEAGITDLDHAAGFRPLDEQARSYRAWARLYLAARSFYGLDWPRALGILNDLYLLAPNFKDTSALLYDGTVSAAAQFGAAGDACQAAEYYAAAQQLRNEPAIAEALTLAQTNCALTPTPDPNAPTPDPNAPTPDPNVTPAPTAEPPTPAP